MSIFKLSKIYQPKLVLPPGKETVTVYTSKSQKLLQQHGLVSQTSLGTYTLLPIALIAMKKLRVIVENELKAIGAQPILLSSLIPEDLLKITERNSLPELFKLKDRHGKSIILGPTHEEAIVHQVASTRPTHHQLPLLLYQISSKFRDEIKPRFGLIRSREFLMKDLYCFSKSTAESRSLYNLVNNCYENIFKRLGVQFCKVIGNTGEIGGYLSHEFHVVAEIGEDKLAVCSNCGIGKNLETEEKRVSSTLKCKDCDKEVTIQNGIEVGHSFLLGTKYTKPLECNFITRDNMSLPLEMSCHGIGLSRLLAAVVESLSSPAAIKWPSAIAPFSIILIPPKAGSKEEAAGIINIDKIARLCGDGIDVLIDDRTDLTIGKRLAEAKSMGYPFIVIFGKAILENIPKIELLDTRKNKCVLYPLIELSSILRLILNE